MAKSAKTKNYQSYETWMREKKVGRPRQQWHWDFVELHEDGLRIKGGRGHWEKI